MRSGLQIRACRQLLLALIQELFRGDRLAEIRVGLRLVEHADQELARRVRAGGLRARRLRLSARDARPATTRRRVQRRSRAGTRPWSTALRLCAASTNLVARYQPRRRMRGNRLPGDMAFDVLGERAGRCVALLRVPVRALSDRMLSRSPRKRLRSSADAGSAGTTPGYLGPHRWTTAADGRRVTRAGRWPSRSSCSRYAERIDVGRGRHRLRGDLFRRGVVGREYADGRAFDIFFEQFRDAEIEELHRTVGRDQDVRGLDVAMDDQRAMCGLDRATDRQEEIEPRGI